MVYQHDGAVFLVELCVDENLAIWRNRRIGGVLFQTQNLSRVLTPKIVEGEGVGL